MRIIPNHRQWKRWSLPSRLTAVGTYVGIIGLLLSIIFFFDQRSPIPIEKRTEELILILESRANRIRSDLQPYQWEPEVSDFIKQFNKLHTEHIAAIRTQNFILAHEKLAEIYHLLGKLEKSDFWHQHKEKLISEGHLTDSSPFNNGSIIRFYIIGPFRSESQLPLELLIEANDKDKAIQLYNVILSSDSIFEHPIQLMVAGIFCLVLIAFIIVVLIILIKELVLWLKERMS